MIRNENISHDNARLVPLLLSSEATGVARRPSLLKSSGTTCRAARRGNSLILVTAILVLLVIIASAYITRVQSSRITGAATQYLSERENIADKIAQDFAKEIAEHLFVRPTDGGALDSNTPRLAIPADAVRYGPSLADLALLPPVRHNVPPFGVKPETNWPDNALYPLSLDNPAGANFVNLYGLGEGNPLGEPGFGDTRWLSSTEPIRFTLAGLDGIFGNVDDVKIFSHYRHLAYPCRPNNGWRLCYDIANVDAALLTDLSLPVEQFLAVRPGGAGANSAINTDTGLPRVPDDFFDRRNAWFDPSPGGYALSYIDPTRILPNFLRLKDLDGDGEPYTYSDLPSDEFILGTARNAVSRTLCDTDGDGFTDSFWFLAPASIDRSVRTVVGLRIVDNASLANINVATAFVPGDNAFFGTDVQTRGTTPADLALIGELRHMNATQANNPTLLNWNLGLFDFPGHWARTPLTNYFSGLSAPNAQEYWLRHINGLGMPVQNNNRPNQEQRLAWWRNVGVEGPLTPSMQFGFTPYALDDELELRMFSGNNNAWSYSRLEQATQLSTSSAGIGNNSGRFILRGELDREESAEFMDQLSNLELVSDMRRKLTTYNATRNDLLPVWLWPDNWPALNAFYRQKIDLRAREGDYDRSGFTNNVDRELLRDVIERALLSEETEETYYGKTTADPDNAPRTARVAAMLAANIIGYSDNDTNAPLRDKIRVSTDTNSQGVTGEFYAYGLEVQPFLVEAMVGHIYESDYVAANDHPDSNNGGDIMPGDRIVCNDSPNTTFVVVQIANPFNSPVPFQSTDGTEHFEVEVFGQPFDLRQLALSGIGNQPLTALQPATYASPRTLTIIAIDGTFQGDPLQAPWVDFLELDDPSIILIDLKNYGTPWETRRTRYDAGMNATGMVPQRDDVVQLIRVSPDPQSGGVARVIIDRFDDPGVPDFGDNLGPGAFGPETARLAPKAPAGDCDLEPAAGTPWPGVKNISAIEPQATHWMQWTHVTRAWGIRPDLDGRAHRFVFANHEISTGENAFYYGGVNGVSGINPGDINEWRAVFDHKEYATTGFPGKGFDGTQAGSDLEFSFQMNWKDDDIEQLGELTNILANGHLLLYGTGGGGYQRTLQTFSEFLQEDLRGLPQPKVRVGRLNPFRPGSVITGNEPSTGFVLQVGQRVPPKPPAMPAALRVLEAFVCDGRGYNGVDGDDELRLAHDFTGRPVHGLVNINTALPEVLRMLPHMTRIIHAQGFVGMPSGGFGAMPRVAVPEAIVQARDMFSGSTNTSGNPPYQTGQPNGPDYKDRNKLGFDGVGELLFVNKDAQSDVFEFNQLLVKQEAWAIDFAGKKPFEEDATITPKPEATYISTDLLGSNPDNINGDDVAVDAEEFNLLFSGLSSMVTTRSDTFTVYFRVRSFRQNPTTGVWNAMDPEYIVDDSRYVMLVDRSNVNSPGDKPRILYLEKLPN